MVRPVSNADSGASAPTPADAETEYERLLHKLGETKARITHLNREVTTDDVPFEVKSTIAFLSGDITECIERTVRYIEGDGRMPETCPVCGDPITEVDELNEGESYPVEKFCVTEKTPGGPGHGFYHFKDE